MSEQTVVKPAGEVNINRVDPPAKDPVVDVEKLSVAQYADKLEAEARGETYTPPKIEETIVVPAAGTDAAAAAAATAAEEAAAAATAKAEEDAKKKAEDDAAALAASETPEKLKEARDAAQAKATKEAADAEKARKEAAEAQAEVVRLKAEAETKAAAALAVPKAGDDPLPVKESFDDPEKYEDALRSHAARREIRAANERAQEAAKVASDAAAKKQEEDRQKKVQEQIADLHKTFNERVAAAKVDIPDYDVKVTNNEKLILRNDIFFTIEQMSMPAHVLAHLADNPEEAAELNKLPPIVAATRLGELQAEIRVALKPKPSAASRPIKPVGQRASPERKTPDEEDMKEYAARREKEDAAARASRKNVRLLN